LTFEHTLRSVHLQVPDSPALAFSKNFSLQVWVKPDSWSDVMGWQREPGADALPVSACCARHPRHPRHPRITAAPTVFARIFCPHPVTCWRGQGGRRSLQRRGHGATGLVSTVCARVCTSVRVHVRGVQCRLPACMHDVHV